LQKLVQKNTERIKLFQESIKSEHTKRAYLIHFKKYREYLGSKFNSLLQEENPDPKKIEQSIIDYIILLKKTKSYAAIHNYVSAITAFYKINDIMLNVNKISRFMPEQRKSNKDRSYKHEEILKLLEFADERMRVVILLLASTGMRIGAIPSLRLSNLEKIEIEIETSIYKITVYENDKEEYFTYCTPECSKAIDEYLGMRSRYGEKINNNNNTLLIREQFDIRDPFAISRPVKIISKTLETKLVELAIRSGIRKKQILEENEKYLGSSFRKDVALCHGFRKFFTTQLVNSKLNPEIREMLLGHKIGLASCYYKPTEDDFLIEYQKAINNLTINEVNKLKMKVKKLEIEKSQLQQLANDVAILKKKWRSR
jgi:integrase